MNAAPVLDIKNLNVIYQTDNPVIAVKNVNLPVFPNETVGIVGESGCGKSTLAFAVLGYLHRLARCEGEILFDGEDLTKKNRKQLTKYRGTKLSMVYQNPYSSLNPSIRIGDQLAEVGTFHKRISKRAALKESLDMLERLNIPDAGLVMKRYPHQISGGMQQRVCIGMALLCEPKLLVMDEPTTALDVTTEIVILDMIRELKNIFETSIIYITHDLRVVSTIADRVAVMYKGEVVETGAKNDVFRSPRHPYTEALLECMPGRGVTKEIRRLSTIPGYVTKRNEMDNSCPFRERCTRIGPECEDEYLLREVAPGHYCSCDRGLIPGDVPRPEGRPAGLLPHDGAREETVPHAPENGGEAAVRAESGSATVSSEVLKPTGAEAGEQILTVEHLKHYYKTPRRTLRAVDDVGFYLQKNHVVGIVGESGCGKSTTALCIQGLLEPTAGKIIYKENNIAVAWNKRDRKTLKEIQMVFQNPARSLNPSFTIERILSRPLRVLAKVNDPAERRRKMVDILSKVGLSEDYLSRKPTQLSGGELQRVAVARVFIVNPELVICDEPTSALDVSVQSAVLNLLIDLQGQTEISYLFISHDLHVVNYISDFIIVMYLGKVAEFGTTAEIFNAPSHPYTEALLSAIPEMEEDIKKETIRLEGSVPSVSKEIPGCRFASRCPRKVGEICETVEPPAIAVSDIHWIYCHIPADELTMLQK